MPHRSAVKSHQPPQRSGVLEFAIILAVGIVVCLSTYRTILFVTADLGRHIKNGEIISKLGLNAPVIHGNHYSFTYPEFSFINHHWLSGWVYYQLQHEFGFSGLSIFQMLIQSSTFALFLVSGWLVLRSSTHKRSFDFLVLAVLAWICLPLVLSRNEVRPESFSYFFCGLLCLLFLLARVKQSSSYLIPVPAVLMIWANTHIYFFCGFLIYGFFVLEDLFDQWVHKRGFIVNIVDYLKSRSTLLFLGLVSFLATLINPIGFRLILYPLQILSDYGYLVAENQSVAFFWSHPLKIDAMESYYGLVILAAAGMVVCGFIGNTRSLLRAEVLLGVWFLVFGFQAIRNFPLAGLFGIPLLARVWLVCNQGLGRWVWLKTTIVGGALVFGIWINGRSLVKVIEVQKISFGRGLVSTDLGGAVFAKNIGLKGPFFNNYDIGGYLIYHFFPAERVFVDNRPEAYPSDFFKKIYVPMQENQSIWQQQLDLYRFNAIYFYYLDITPAAQTFLKARLNDSEWIPIYADQVAIIFVKKNQLNKSLIERYALPKSIFKFGPS